MSLAPDEKFCASCGEPIKEQAVHCPECGVPNDGTGPPSSSGTVFCESCGDQIHSDAEVCPSCGVRQTSSNKSFDSDFEELVYYGQIILGALVVLFGLGTVTNGDLVSILVGIPAIVAGLVLIPDFRETLPKRHDLTTFGWTRNVTSTPVSNPHQSCTSCGGDIESGVRREYGSDLAVAGVVLTSRTEGENMYCESCLAVERGLDAAETTVDVEESHSEL
jgi:predicted RNA-binding Zn-ribbon protein involved in translation (DUF1610 family)